MTQEAVTTPKMMLNEFAWDERYRIRDTADVMTPALVIYPEVVALNIERTLTLIDGNPDRWRAHIKTSKLNYSLRMLVQRGVRNFKCATTLELLMACRSGAQDILVAYPMMGANARRVQEVVTEFPRVRISVLAENDEQIMQWRGSRIGIFLDVNPGMNRTGIESSQGEKIAVLARKIESTGLEFRGLHYYDGQFGAIPATERNEATRAGYDRLLQVVSEIEASGTHVPEVITAGTPTFPCSLAYTEFRNKKFTHRISPGTIVYNDATSLAQLSTAYGYRPAALVVTRVVSRPRTGIITCDAGHKAVSADAGLPTCIVIGHKDLAPLSPSEEHLPMAVEGGADGPPCGEVLYLLPRHVCPTVNNFDCALVTRNGEIESVEKVSARGREAPLLREVEQTISAR